METRQEIPSGPVPDTSTTLLRNLAANGAAQAEWARFARLYDPVCRYYLAILRRGWPALLRDWDDDIVQDALVELVRLLPERKWDRAQGRFRDFLFGVVRNKTLAFAKRESRVPLPSETALETLAKHPAADVAAAEREALRRELWRALVDRVFAASRMSETSKTVFLRLVEDETPVDTLAAEFGMTRNAIYRLKNRMSGKLREEWLAVGGDSSDPADALEALAREILA